MLRLAKPTVNAASSWGLNLAVPKRETKYILLDRKGRGGWAKISCERDAEKLPRRQKRARQRRIDLQHQASKARLSTAAHISIQSPSLQADGANSRNLIGREWCGNSSQRSLCYLLSTIIDVAAHSPPLPDAPGGGGLRQNFRKTAPALHPTKIKMK